MRRQLATPPFDRHLTGLGRRLLHRLIRSASLALSVLVCWHELARERRRLLELDERMLKDLGISRADALQEAGRPFWDVPVRGWPDWR